MISEVPQQRDSDLTASISQHTPLDVSSGSAGDSEPQVSQCNSEMASQVEIPSPKVSSEQNQSTTEFTMQASVSSPHFAVPDGRIFLDICSGSARPLSAAVLAMGCDVLSFDILLDSAMDLLRDDSYEQLLRICSSGQVVMDQLLQPAVIIPG